MKDLLEWFREWRFSAYERIAYKLLGVDPDARTCSYCEYGKIEP